MKPLCSVDGCERRSLAKGLCNAHYIRWKTSGDVQADKPLQDKVKGAPPVRFWAYVNKTEGCWLWEGGTISTGYGIFNAGRPSPVLAHRFAYEDVVGQIPEGKHLDHLCRVILCVRPDHLEPVTNRENTRRGLKGILQTHCKQGHPLTEDNLYYRANSDQKRCRECQRGHSRRAAERKRESR